MLDASGDALDCLRKYSWPGNLRELQSVLKQALLRSSGIVLLPSMLPESVRHELPAAVSAEPQGHQTGLTEFIRQQLESGSEVVHEQVHRELDMILLSKVMEHTRGNQFQAARVLGIARQTLRRRLRELKITPRFSDEMEMAM